MHGSHSLYYTTSQNCINPRSEELDLMDGYKKNTFLRRLHTLVSTLKFQNGFLENNFQSIV